MASSLQARFVSSSSAKMNFNQSFHWHTRWLLFPHYIYSIGYAHRFDMPPFQSY